MPNRNVNPVRAATSRRRVHRLTRPRARAPLGWLVTDATRTPTA